MKNSIINMKTYRMGLVAIFMVNCSFAANLIEQELVSSIWNAVAESRDRSLASGHFLWRQTMVESNDPRLTSDLGDDSAVSFSSELYLWKDGHYLKRIAHANSGDRVSLYYQDSVDQMYRILNSNHLQIGLSVVNPKGQFVVNNAKGIVTSGRSWLKTLSLENVVDVVKRDDGGIVLSLQKGDVLHEITLDPSLGYAATVWKSVNGNGGGIREYTYIYTSEDDASRDMAFPIKVISEMSNDDTKTKIIYEFDVIDLDPSVREKILRDQLLQGVFVVNDSRVPEGPRTYYSKLPTYPVPSYNEFLELQSNRTLFAEFALERRHLADEN